MIAAERLAQPPGLIGSLVQDLETISEEAEEERPSQSLPLDLLDTASSTSLSPSESGNGVPPGYTGPTIEIQQGCPARNGAGGSERIRSGHGMTFGPASAAPSTIRTLQ